MRTVFIVIALAVLGFTAGLVAQEEKLYSPPTFAEIEQGYRVAHLSIDLHDCNTCFEGIAHYNDLYDGSRKLGRIGNYSISDSGRFAVWEDNSSDARKFNGRVLLYDRKTSEIRDITDRPFALPSRFNWDESQLTLRINYYENNGRKHKPTIVRLAEVTSTGGRVQ
jgi:hypothetical protein